MPLSMWPLSHKLALNVVCFSTFKLPTDMASVAWKRFWQLPMSEWGGHKSLNGIAYWSTHKIFFFPIFSSQQYKMNFHSTCEIHLLLFFWPSATLFDGHFYGGGGQAIKVVEVCVETHYRWNLCQRIGISLATSHPLIGLLVCCCLHCCPTSVDIRLFRFKPKIRPNTINVC